MYNQVSDTINEITKIVENSFKKSIESGELTQAEIPSFTVEIPGDTTHGDFATNAAMVSAKAFRLPPRKIAETIVKNIETENTHLEKVEIAGPGFINFSLSHAWFSEVVGKILEAGDDYGKTDYGKGEKVMLEFVSANPTGPMHMGNARGGSVGDCLASVMKLAGYNVHKEFYINDAGNQIEKFGVSLEARYLQIYKGEEAVPFPEDGYHGSDITERAQAFADINGDKYVNADSKERKEALVAYALPANVENLRRDLEKYRIVFDEWFPESSLHESGAVTKAIDTLKEKGMAYEKDGAIWYKATEFGGEKDEVLVRANGIPTYFAADIAYHYNKFVTRGYDRLINVWGADHHGHVARLKGAMDAIGLDGSKLDIILMQLVRLTKNGEPVRMSKRTGKSITLSDLIEEIPIEAARFFFNTREASSTLDFDLDLAVEESSKNPVYYVQYAHARICGILKNLTAENIVWDKPSAEDLLLLKSPEEIELIRMLSKLPTEIIASAKNYDPARLTHYVMDVANHFHKFYNACKVRVDDKSLLSARASLCTATATVIRNVLMIMKIEAPESM